MGNLTKKDALFIAKKLGATIQTKKKAHDRAIISHNGRVVATFGIRRGSGEQDHGHIPKELQLGPHETKLLAECTLSRDQWLAKLKEKGLI